MITALLHSGDDTTPITSDTWLDEITRRNYGAFIFDCDGTLVESADVHFQSFAHAISEQGQTLDKDWYLARTGLDRISLFAEFAGDVGPLDSMRAAQRSIDAFVAISDQVQTIPETLHLVQTLSKTHPLAVGTNAENAVATASLTATGLLALFDHIVAIDDGHAPKPAPDIFVKAAQLLGTDHRVLVIEDSPQGVSAARSAGLDVIHILSIS